MPSENHPMAEPFGEGRLTPQRAAIAECAAEMRGAFTVDELGAAMRRRDGAVGTATLYRAVAALEASGWLERVGERGGSALFARCTAAGGHHHHLICDGCGRIEATSCPVEPGSISAAEKGGFTVTRHEVTLYGLCATCAGGGAADATTSGAADGGAAPGIGAER